MANIVHATSVDGAGRMAIVADKVTARKVRGMKGQSVVCVTAYDAPFAAMADEAGIDVVLVGDSLGNVVLGYESTIPVTLEEILHHTRAVRRGVRRALLVSDLPFGAYQASVESAVNAAVALVKAGAEAVKLEGAYFEQIREIVRAGIPVMGHVGFTPQSLNVFGGFRVQGRGEDGEEIMRQSIEVEAAGAFSFVVELVPATLAEQITRSVGIPTIGIGAGAGCDGQIQVFHDVVGFTKQPLRHARSFGPGRQAMIDGLSAYAASVRDKSFPDGDHSF